METKNIKGKTKEDILIPILTMVGTVFMAIMSILYLIHWVAELVNV